MAVSNAAVSEHVVELVTLSQSRAQSAGLNNNNAPTLTSSGFLSIEGTALALSSQTLGYS